MFGISAGRSFHKLRCVKLCMNGSGQQGFSSTLDEDRKGCHGENCDGNEIRLKGSNHVMKNFNERSKILKVILS